MYEVDTMDDSSLFMQWAMDTLHHEQPPVAAAYVGDDTFPSLQELRRSALQHGTAPAEAVAQDGHRQLAADSWSSGDSGGGRENVSAAVVDNDGWSSNSANCARSCSVGSNNYLPMSWNFTSAMAQPSQEPALSPALPQPSHDPAPSPATAPSGAPDGSGVTEQAQASPPSRTRRASAKNAAKTRHASTAPYAQDHIMAERKRREKINRRFIELSTVIPGLKKMDKATILSDAVKYVKEQQEKLKALEGRDRRSVDSVVLVKKRCNAAVREDDVGGGCPSPSAAVAGGKTTRTCDAALPEIEARISESNVMVRIHCEDGKGVLVRLLAEVEGLHLSITHTSVVPFPACTVNITVMAKVDEGFSVTAADIVGKLESALHPRHSGK